MLQNNSITTKTKQKYNIEEITFKDAVQLEQIGKKCLPIYYSASDILFLLFDSDYVLYKISNNTKIVGFIIAKKKYHEYNSDDDNNEENNNNKISQIIRFHIMSIGILPKFRKCGLATNLIKTLKQNITNKYKYKIKLSLFVLTNNKAAIKLYEKNNFFRIFEDENYYESLPHKNAYYYETK